MSTQLAVPIVTERYGDSAVMVTVGHPDAALRAGHIVDVRDRLVSRRPFGVTDVVSGLESLLVEFDPLVTAAEHVEYALRLLAELPRVTALSATPKSFVIPLVVTEQTAPDLEEVAAEWGVTTESVIDHVLASTLTISLLGAAMAPMMAGLKTVRPIRRRAEPRTNVPPGSVMVAGTNAIIQPFPGPTGWRVIGRTPLTIVDIHQSEPVTFSTGDVVRFERVDADEAARRDGEFLVPETTGARA